MLLFTPPVEFSIVKNENVCVGSCPGSSIKVILDLWLAEGVFSAPFNANYESSKGKYPSNMYGTSKIRSVSLNNGRLFPSKIRLSVIEL